MSLGSQQYAHLARDAYDPRKRNEDATLHGVTYKVLEHVDRPTGYQGTIYQRIDTGEIVVAHRGTEFDKGWIDKLQDGALADGGMVLARANLQADDAIELTRRALAWAETRAPLYGHPLEVTVTGHSLGGCLAQITAHHFDLRGETFNAYGAVGLNRRIPEGGDKVVNHVMATDIVSSGSPHYGHVRVYATRQEVEAMTQSGYENDRNPVDRRNPLGPITKLGFEAHLMHNFVDVDSQGRPDRSVLNDPQARLFARRFDPMIDKYRNDIGTMRAGLTTGARGVPGMLNDAVDYIRGPLEPGEPARREQRSQAPLVNPEHQLPKHQLEQFWQTPGAFMGQRVSIAEPSMEVRQPEPALLSYLDSAHPNHRLYQELRDKLPADVSNEKVAEFTLAAREGGVQANKVGSAHVHDGKAWVLGTIPGFDGMVNLRTPAPPMAETMQKAEAFEQKHQAQVAQRQEQQHQSQSQGRLMA